MFGLKSFLSGVYHQFTASVRYIFANTRTNYSILVSPAPTLLSNSIKSSKQELDDDDDNNTNIQLAHHDIHSNLQIVGCKMMCAFLINSFTTNCCDGTIEYVKNSCNCDGTIGYVKNSFNCDGTIEYVIYV